MPRGPVVVLFASLLLVPVLLAPLAGASPAVLLPPQGPDVPTTGAPVATVVAFDNETYSFTEGVRTRTVSVPAGPWDRVVVVFRGIPGGDPWDRFFGVGIGGAEVLRGTTPRADFTVRKDVTEFAGLLPPGGTAQVNLFYGSYVGAPRLTVKLEFHDDPETAGLVKPPADHVLRPFAWNYFGGHGATLQSTVAFPAAVPSRASVELSLTGHGGAEFWYQSNPVPRVFHVYVGDVEIARAYTLPYTYAFLGFCCGTITVVHVVMWWTGQQALDVVGVHGGVGEIPPYRAEVPAEHLHLLAGNQTVRVVQEGPTGYWVTGLNLLLHE